MSGLPILDALVPRMAPDWVQDPILQRLREQLLMNDTEQEIEVPKISSTSCPLRAVLAATQMAEQLVEVPVVFPAECVLNVPLPQVGDELLEVPTVVSQLVEQTVDIPVHGGVKRARRGFHGSVPGQSSTASCRGGPSGFSTGQGSTALSGADHHSQSFVRKQSSTALRGAELH